MISDFECSQFYHYDHDHHAHHGGNESHDSMLLSYMLDHNEHHMDELLECAQSLRANGYDMAAILTEESAMLLEQSNAKLNEAITALGEGSK